MVLVDFEINFKSLPFDYRRQVIGPWKGSGGGV